MHKSPSLFMPLQHLPVQKVFLRPAVSGSIRKALGCFGCIVVKPDPTKFEDMKRNVHPPCVS